jgi:hypothetical protein
MRFDMKVTRTLPLVWISSRMDKSTSMFPSTQTGQQSGPLSYGIINPVSYR